MAPKLYSCSLYDVLCALGCVWHKAWHSGGQRLVIDGWGSRVRCPPKQSPMRDTGFQDRHGCTAHKQANKLGHFLSRPVTNKYWCPSRDDVTFWTLAQHTLPYHLLPLKRCWLNHWCDFIFISIGNKRRRSPNENMGSLWTICYRVHVQMQTEKWTLKSASKDRRKEGVS